MQIPIIPTLLLFLLPTLAHSSPPTTNYSSPWPLPPPIPLISTATSYPSSLLPQNPIAELQIRNTLAHYPIAIDGKNFAALDLVFAPDVVANLSAPFGVLNGVETVKSVIETALEKVLTQHALSTTVVEILEGGRRAKSLAYFTATHFGVGKFEGQVLYAYGQYQDEWARTCCPEQWRIKTRSLVYMGPNLGNVSIFS